ncbi:MAG: NAD(P)/FAD-dependent oxidoreductase [Campylobacteraceae bacterium]|nr:NAD(P)/FAD-dependent oxidoreductase [Campylobacteraceae bacterium]
MEKQKKDNPPMQCNGRRKALKLLAGGGIGAVLATGATITTGNALSQPKTKKVKTSAHIVIVGAGAAGLTAASKLARSLEGAKITLIDTEEVNNYQPGFTLIGAGLKPLNYTKSTTASYVPKEANWVKEMAVEIDPDANKVVTSSGKVFDYDYLIVATGLTLRYDKIEGMDISLIGKEGITSIYPSPEAAYASWQVMSKFTDVGGVGIFHRPKTEMKCAGAPIKYTCLTEDYLVRKGTRDKSEIIFNAQNKTLFSVPIISERIRMMWLERDIKWNYDRELIAIDPGKKIATFSTPDGNDEMKYDMIHVVPPMYAPDVIKNSPLAWQSGKFGDEGWMEVDMSTLRHARYKNVFGVGDIAGVPKGKTGASVKWQVPVAVNHIVADIAGEVSDSKYNGYTSCPLLTRLGRAMLIEFDYNNNLTPSFPGLIAPLEEQWLSWIMKTTSLQPNYQAMMRGLM